MIIISCFLLKVVNMHWRIFKVFLTALRVVDMYQMHENIFKHSNKLKLFLIHDFFWAYFLGAETVRLVSKMLWLWPWDCEQKQGQNKYSQDIAVPKTLKFWVGI